MRKQLCILAPVDPVVVGKMGAAHGLHGCLKVFSSTEDAKSILNYQPWFIKIESKWQPLGLESWKHYKRDIIIKIRDIKDRKSASLMTNCEIVVDASQLPNLDGGEYYWKDLIGCKVISVDGYHLGKVVDLIETGSNDVFVVKANLEDAFGIQERLIPFLDGQVIKHIDLAKHIIEVEWDLSLLA